jgi:hypothetical protein
MPTQVYNKWFSLDAKTGIVRTTNSEEQGFSIDYEKFKEVLLGVDAIDPRTLEIIETIVIKIEINDLNDNPPVFDLKYNYEVFIDEDNEQTSSQERLITKV